jgi:hypothetical protein
MLKIEVIAQLEPKGLDIGTIACEINSNSRWVIWKVWRGNL